MSDYIGVIVEGVPMCSRHFHPGDVRREEDRVVIDGVSTIYRCHVCGDYFGGHGFDISDPQARIDCGNWYEMYQGVFVAEPSAPRQQRCAW